MSERSHPKVSVVMSVYNGEKYLREAIDSILSQTFSDFEFIIINDGSTDRTGEIIESYFDPRIRLIHQQNIGLTKSLNKGLKIARGEYIARQDADDTSLPARLERQVKLLEQHKNIGLLGTSWYRIDNKGQKIGIENAANGKQAVHFICHGTALIRKRCLEEVGFYREVFQYAQDYDLWLRIADKFEVINLADPLYKLRTHKESTSSTKKLQQNLYASLAIDMAEQRKRTGKDKISFIDEEETKKIARDRLAVSGRKQKEILSRNYSTWSGAAITSDDYGRAYYYAIDSLGLNILNYRAWSIVIKVITKELCRHPTVVTTKTREFLTRIDGRLRQKIVHTLISLNIPWARKVYWNMRAPDIDEKWGADKDDYALLRDIILSLKPQRLLDVGCGSGRLFPLYNDSEISEVVAQDISSEALKMAKDRYHFSNIKTTGQPILDLKFPMHYFDLIVSNRVLQHMPCGQIEVVIRKLTKLGKLIYINEMCDSDSVDESFYLFHHDYVELFNKYGFKVIQKGLLANKTWFLFSENI